MGVKHVLLTSYMGLEGPEPLHDNELRLSSLVAVTDVGGGGDFNVCGPYLYNTWASLRVWCMRLCMGTSQSWDMLAIYLMPIGSPGVRQGGVL